MPVEIRNRFASSHTSGEAFRKKSVSLIFTFMHLADTFIQSDLQCIQHIHLISVCAFPGNRTHNLCTANAML